MLFMKPLFPGRSHRAATCYDSLDQAGLGRIRKYRWASSPAWGRYDYKQQDWDMRLQRPDGGGVTPSRKSTWHPPQKAARTIGGGSHNRDIHSSSSHVPRPAHFPLPKGKPSWDCARQAVSKTRKQVADNVTMRKREVSAHGAISDTTHRCLILRAAFPRRCVPSHPPGGVTGSERRGHPLVW